MVQNTLSIAEIKRRGMPAIDEGLRRGPVHIIKRNKLAAVVLSEAEYLRLTQGRTSPVPGVTAMQWLLSQTPATPRSKQQIDDELHTERAW